MGRKLGSNIDPLDELEAMEDTPLAEPVKVDPLQKRVRIILEESDNISPGGQFFGVNGYAYMLKPGVEADVPLAIINVLNDAVESIPVIDNSSGMSSISGWRHRLRFPYRVIKEL